VNLLTPQETAALLKVSERTLRRLRLPRVKVGKQYRYRPADIDGFINLHLEYPETGGHNVSRIQKKSKAVGLSVLPSRTMLQQIRMGHQNGGKTGGAGGVQ
jgi:excisionase family DNA binding protein